MTPAGNPPDRFEFATATRLVFGAGTAAEAGSMARPFGERALLVTGSRPERAAPLTASLESAGIRVFPFPVAGEPTVDRIRAIVDAARPLAPELVVACGGGSVIDAGKAVAGLLGNPGDPFDHLEVIGRGRPLERPALPWIALPTTAGAGAEVTRNAVLTSPEHRVKASLRSPLLLARIAIIDPQLTLSLPADVTAATGLDALTQLIEPFVCRRPNPLVDPLCLDGIRRIARSLRRACDAGHDLDARSDLAFAALLGGLALANAGLGAVHGLAAPLGGAHPAPHGAVCAALLAPVMATNLTALATRAPDHPARLRYVQVARTLTGHPGASAADGVDWVAGLVRDLAIPTLGTYGVRPEHFDDLAAKAAAASSMKANPLPLTHTEVVGILETAYASPCTAPR